MEEEKAAAYYDELTRKGQSAARFKQGLGFSSNSNSNSNSNLVSNNNHHLTFVKSTTTTSPSATSHHNKQSHLLSIHNKLTQTKPRPLSSSSSSHKHRDTDRHSDRDRDSEHGYKDKGHSRRSCSRDRYRDRRIRRRSRSRSCSDGDRRRTRRTSVSRSPEKKTKRGDDVIQRRKKTDGLDYANLIHGYAKMSPAERVKAKMKFQLTETAEKDAINGMGSGWERFDFDKDAPLDDEEMEVADDDVSLVKHIGQSFRFSAVEANRDDKIKAAHDEAMFGSSSVFPSIHTEGIIEHENESKVKESASATSLLSDKVIAGQQGSWRDRTRKA